MRAAVRSSMSCIRGMGCHTVLVCSSVKAAETLRSRSCARGTCPEARACPHGSLPPTIWAMAVGNFRGQNGGPHPLSGPVRRSLNRQLPTVEYSRPTPEIVWPDCARASKDQGSPSMAARPRDARHGENDMPGAIATRRTPKLRQTARSRPKTVNCFAPHVQSFRLSKPKSASACFVPHTHRS